MPKSVKHVKLTKCAKLCAKRVKLYQTYKIYRMHYCVNSAPNVKLCAELTAECAITYTKVILCTQSKLQVLNQHP